MADTSKKDTQDEDAVAGSIGWRGGWGEMDTFAGLREGFRRL